MRLDRIEFEKKQREALRKKIAIWSFFLLGGFYFFVRIFIGLVNR